MAKKTKGSTKLPKAPLIEVVFELRWNLQGVAEKQAAVLHSDPGIIPLLDAFTSSLKKAKFGFARDMSPPLQTGPYGVVRRYFRSSETPYPILQIGVGIFAANASSQYEWPSFREQILLGIRALLRSYPKMDFFPLSPNYLELRYIDIFDQTVTGGADFVEFLNKETAFKIDLPKMLHNRKIVSAERVGRLAFQMELKGWKASRLSMDLGSATTQNDNAEAIRMITQIITTEAGVPKLINKTTFPNQVAKWLDFAHDRVTSPLFKDVLSENIMRKFKDL